MFKNKISDITIAQRKLSGLCTRCGVFSAAFEYRCTECYMYEVLPETIRDQIDADILNSMTNQAKMVSDEN